MHSEAALAWPESEARPPERHVSNRSRAWARFVRNRAAVASVAVLTLIAVLALFADQLGRMSPVAVDLMAIRSGPSGMHPLGTDEVGRDVWSRLVHASRVSLAVGFLSVGFYTVLGVALGSIAGFYGGVLDSLLLRIGDVVLSFPQLVLVLVAVSISGPGLAQIILVIAIFGWPGIARLVRGQFLSLRELEFVTAARAIGARNRRIIVLHLLPNTVGVVVVAATFGIARTILIEASLSFLGMGVQPPTASWGNMLNGAQSLAALEMYPWLWLPPGLMIVLTILAVNFIGDGLRDALDPRSKLT